MLTPDEIREIEAAIHSYEHRAAGCLEALKIAQAHRRWVSDETVRDVAALLGMGPAEVESVATFYSLIFRQPVGRHVILVCDSVSCWLLGYERLFAHLDRRLGLKPGQTTADGEFTLLPTACLGACDRAPALMIDDELYGNLDEAKLDALLDACRQKDRA
jgi:NADH-quinone oxidoreductase subunit E